MMCPRCKSDDVEVDPPYAECITCGHQDQASKFEEDDR